MTTIGWAQQLPEPQKMAPMPVGAPATAGRHDRGPTAWERALDAAPLVLPHLPLQAKLAVNESGDAYEQEADRVAAQVLMMPAEQAAPVHVQRQVTAPQQGHPAPRSVHAVLQTPGRPLDPGMRTWMEGRFGYDFGRVRVHDDVRAAASAQDVQAHAYTLGEHVVFRQPLYTSGTDGGKRLLAHELTHVVQQTGGGSSAALQRQADEEPENGNAITIEEEGLFAEDPALAEEELLGQDEGAAAQRMVQTMPEAAGGLLQRQGPDIPPPPPAFPSVYTWLPHVFQDTVGLWNLTCADRCERGFYVFWNERTGAIWAGDVAIGEAVATCKAATIELGPTPPDRPPVYPVGWFHTHPPPAPGCHKVAVGPSTTDQNTSRDLKMPGAVEDWATPASGCRKAGFWFFGPTTRAGY